MKAYESTILSLLKRGVFGVEETLVGELDFEKLYEEGKHQTVLPLVYAAFTEEERAAIPANALSKWKNAFYAYMLKNEQLLYEQSCIVEHFEKQGLPCVVLKGSGIAREYPDPALRVLGDIDLLVAPTQVDEAVEILQELSFTKKADGDLHVALYKGAIIVELHKQPVALGFNESEKILQKINDFFADILEKRQWINGVPYPTEEHQAAVLLLHALEHFLKGELGLRQLCDWAVFVKNRCTPILWEGLFPELESFGILTFTKVLTKGCVNFLGLPREYAPWTEDCDSELAKEVVELIVESGNFGRKVENSYGQRLFVDAHSNNRFTSFFKVLFSACRTHWQPCAKHPFLLPIAPIVVYCKYLKLRWQGKRQKLKLGALYQRAGTRQKLYKELKPFINTKEETS